MSKTRALFSICLLAAAAPMVLLRPHQRQVGFVRVLGALSVALSVWLLTNGAVLAVKGFHGNRMQIEDANPIAVGRMAGLGIVIFALTFLRVHGLPRLGALAGFALCVVAEVSTGSRGPLVAAVAAVAIVSVFTRSRRPRIRSLAALTVVAVAAWEALVHFAPPLSALERITGAFGGTADNERLRLATESLTIAWHNWGGVGWGDLGNYLSAGARSAVQGWAQYPHNIIIEALAEGGVLGLLGLVIMLVVSWRRLRINATNLTGLILLGLWLFALGSALTSSDLTGNRLTWMMIGVGLALPFAAKRTAPVDPVDRPVAAHDASDVVDRRQGCPAESPGAIGASPGTNG